MLGEEYFRRTQGACSSYAQVPYMTGTCTMRRDDRSVNGRWELSLPLTGECTFVFHGDPLQTAFGGSGPVEQWQVEGQTDDGGWQISGGPLLSGRSSHQYGTSSPGTTEVKSGQWMIVERLELRREPAAEPDAVRAYLRNFDFRGLEFSEVPGGRRRDRLTVPVADREVTFRSLPHGEPRRQLMHDGVIDRALLTTLSVPVERDGGLEDCREVLENLVWMSQIVQPTPIHPPFMELLADGEVVGMDFTSANCAAWGVPRVIDSLESRGSDEQMSGLFEFYRDSYERFRELDQSFNMKRVVGLMMATMEQRYISFRLAGLLMCYERFCADLLGHMGVQLNNDPNVEQKLGQLNRHLRFIPSDRRGRELRASIRNPLMHEGLITTQTAEWQIERFNTYWDQFLQILLVALRYGGQYNSPQTGRPVSVPQSPLMNPAT